MVDTGDFYLIILVSKVGAEIYLHMSFLKATERFLPTHLTFANPKAKSILLSYLIKS